MNCVNPVLIIQIDGPLQSQLTETRRVKEEAGMEALLVLCLFYLPCGQENQSLFQ